MEIDVTKLNDSVIRLHDVARSVAEELGSSPLALEIRDCADRLSELIKLVSVE